jgi:predicted XRE-type DNA-binding protein
MKARGKSKDRSVYASASDFAVGMGVARERSLEARLKAKLVAAIRGEIARQGLSHEKVAERAGVARTNVTGIISGSVKSVTLDRLVRIAASLGMSMDLEIKKSA